MSTRSTASRRPENSSQAVTSLSATVATDTGVAAGWALAGASSALASKPCRPNRPALTARMAAAAAGSLQPLRGGEAEEGGEEDEGGSGGMGFFCENQGGRKSVG